MWIKLQTLCGCEQVIGWPDHNRPALRIQVALAFRPTLAWDPRVEEAVTQHIREFELIASVPGPIYREVAK